MKEGGFNRLPRKVKEAIRKDDGEALSAMGRAGARAKEEKEYTKAIRARNMEDMKTHYAEQDALKEYHELIEATNEHILPIESEDEDEAEH